MKKNSIITGIICGIIAPAIVFLLLHTFTFNRFDSGIFTAAGVGILAKMISLSVLGNLAAFFLFLKYDFELAARGVLFSTFLWGAGILILKLLE